ncbi:Trehalose synthase, nucleoside diphosphate glucose dependent [Dissulfuribacter thermophilus]|uniref:Trehalose synthase, nucleoside diphosphate glucose dependent n=1 Tax=Dissulfuribacter thermophilus TaxID=1156395 RepID=A0A1B9F672_9BACT|nr:glycosyltransferase [Dissulfuribacter thermophilus]OCC15373.1 Trehalose synthase, nucleoside diphosphate glucose dependent [Dissulfuribacter thermophilus]
MELLEQYNQVAGKEVVEHLKQLAEPLRGMKVVHVNSTRQGGGVAELLRKIVPMMEALGLDARWEVIEGTNRFFQCTKGFHNSLQGKTVLISESALEEYERVNAQNAEELKPVLQDADFVFIHDPQPAALLKYIPDRKGKWIWRCHIDCSRPYRPVWKYIRNLIVDYDASIFSLAEFAQPLPHPQYIIAPSIDPLSEKNIELPANEVDGIFDQFGLKRDLPLILQVSRFDRFKDPLGVIAAYKEAKRMIPLQLVLAGGGATDDPEGEVVLEEVKRAANGDPDIHILVLPPDAHRTINALQRAADIVLQKSIKEGFGLTVSEAMWKGKPVIGGDTGGIRLQVVDHYTGFKVRTPEGAALRIRYLLHSTEKRFEMGQRAKRFVKDNFLVTRHLREYLALMIAIFHGFEDRIDLSLAP